MPRSAFRGDETLAIQPSKILFGWIVLSVMATAGLVCVYFPLWGGLGISMVCAGCAFQAINRHAVLRQRDSVIAIRFGPTGLAIRQRNGKWHAVQDNPAAISGFVSPALVIIGLHNAGTPARRTVVWLSDSIDPAAARRLRVWLRWKRSVVPDSVSE